MTISRKSESRNVIQQRSQKHNLQWARCDNKRTYVFMYSNLHNCQILIKLEFSRQISYKFSTIKLHENPSSGNRFVRFGRTNKPERQTDRQNNEANSRFRNFAKAPKRWYCTLVYVRFEFPTAFLSGFRSVAL
jgi:hypothetical protein